MTEREANNMMNYNGRDLINEVFSTLANKTNETFFYHFNEYDSRFLKEIKASTNLSQGTIYNYATIILPVKLKQLKKTVNITPLFCNMLGNLNGWRLYIQDSEDSDQEEDREASTLDIYFK